MDQVVLGRAGGILLLIAVALAVLWSWGTIKIEREYKPRHNDAWEELADPGSGRYAVTPVDPGAHPIKGE